MYLINRPWAGKKVFFPAFLDFYFNLSIFRWDGRGTVDGT
jgi:hypothetical protein